MNTYIRRQLEWHFRNYEADKALQSIKANDIAESNIVVGFSKIGSNKCGKADPTARKALLICEINDRGSWAAVVENTFKAFRFEPEYEIMTALYIEKKTWQQFLADGFNESTFWYWRDRWLEVAYQWAKEYELL